MVNRIVVFLLVALAASSQSAQAQVAATPVPDVMKLSGPRTSYLKGGISQRARLVIRERDEFNELWNQIMRPVSNKPPLPEVDFSREMIIVAAMGQQTSLYDIVIESACEVDNQLEVLVSTDFLKCGLQLGMTEPLDIARLSKTDLPVVFRETEVTSDCKELLCPKTWVRVRLTRTSKVTML